MPRRWRSGLAVLALLGACGQPSHSRIRLREASTGEELAQLVAMPTTSTSTSTTSARPIVNQASRSERRPVLTTSTGSLGRFRVTCYGPPQFPAGKHTATGAPVGPGSLAVDPGVIRLGTALTLVGIGDVVADDTGGMVGGHHVDLWRPSCAGWANPTVEIIRR